MALPGSPVLFLKFGYGIPCFDIIVGKSHVAQCFAMLFCVLLCTTVILESVISYVVSVYNVI